MNIKNVLLNFMIFSDGSPSCPNDCCKIKNKENWMSSENNCENDSEVSTIQSEFLLDFSTFFR